jgi:hypothetical protein
MSLIWPAATLVVAFAAARFTSRKRMREPAAEALRPNHAGVLLPVVLGHVLVAAANWAALLGLSLALLAGPVPDWRVPLLLVVSAVSLHAVGAFDDRRADGPRGLRGHIGSLVRGRPTTGILKLVVGIAAGAVVATEIGGGIARVMAGTFVIALSVNVTNALDVRPGRALKWSLLLLIPLAVGAWGEGVTLGLAAYVGSGLVVLPLDLGERGMLGDAGSNPLGLVVGTGLATALSFPSLVASLVILAGLQVAAETITISRIIEAVPPLRWFDRLGRRS